MTTLLLVWAATAAGLLLGEAADRLWPARMDKLCRRLIGKEWDKTWIRKEVGTNESNRLREKNKPRQR